MYIGTTDDLIVNHDLFRRILNIYYIIMQSILSLQATTRAWKNHFWQVGAQKVTNYGGKVVAKSSSVAVISGLDGGCKNKRCLFNLYTDTFFSCNSNLRNQKSSDFCPNFWVNANKNA